MTGLADRYLGSLLGLAVGDALGTTLEFRRPGSFAPIEDLVGGGPFGLLPGQWTDDTAMALCSAESLVACRGFDPADQMRRYLRWYREGYLSCTGHCFDIGHWFLFSEVPIDEWLDAMGPYLRHLHLHDNTGKSDAHLPVGEGKIDFPRFFAALAQRSLAPSITLEAHKPRHLRRSSEAVRTFLGLS